MNRFIRVLRSIHAARQSEDGSIAIIFAASLTVLIALGALTIDLGNALRMRSHIQASADAAALAGVTAAKTYLGSAGSQDTAAVTAANKIATDAAAAFWAANATGDFKTATTTTTTTSIVNGSVTVEMDFLLKVPLSFGQILGLKTMDLNGIAIASLKLPTYIDIYLMVDVSGSMALPVSASDQQLIMNKTGCAFACHDGVPVGGYKDSYTWATANNIVLRLGALNQAITTLMDQVDALDPNHQYIRIQLYSFSDQLTLNAKLTSTTQTVRNNLPTTPTVSSYFTGGTYFNENINTVVSAIGKGGTGKSQSDSLKLLIIATDGVQDPGRIWSILLWRMSEVAVFDMSFCKTAKSNGVYVGFLHTPYVPIPTDWGYNFTLGQPSSTGSGTRADEVPVALKKCGGDLYVQASDLAGIKSAFVTILNKLATSTLTQ